MIAFLTIAAITAICVLAFRRPRGRRYPTPLSIHIVNTTAAARR